MNPRVGVIILNTNRTKDTLDCLQSLAQNSYSNLSIMVLDNTSSEESIDPIRTKHPDVILVKLHENNGYAGNNNVGIRLMLEQGVNWILVLNEDTILAPDCIKKLVKTGDSSSDIGIIGPLVYHADEPQYIQSAGGLFDRYWRPRHIGQNELDRGQFSDPKPVDWISGCALMIRSEILFDIGLLDELFFYYWEETEWCYRAGKRGWQIIHEPRAKLWHKGVQRNYQPNPAVTYYSTRNRLLFLSKYHAPIRAWIVALFEILRPLTSWTLLPKWHYMKEHRNASFLGFIDFMRRRWGQARL